MENVNFEKLWNDYTTLALGTYLKEVKQTGAAKIFLSDIPGRYHSFATPIVSNPQEFDLEAVASLLKENSNDLSIYLSEAHQKAGFVEYLIRKGCKYRGFDSWVVLDNKLYDKPVAVDYSVKEVSKDSFPDFAEVESACFPDFPGNPAYLMVSKKTIGYKNGDIQSKFYVIHENGKPVACGAMLFSRQENIAYLHGAGTLEKYRGKGYQTTLIKHRVNIALENGITRIYSSVEPGSKSWSNCIKTGFYQATSYLMLE